MEGVNASFGYLAPIMNSERMNIKLLNTKFTNEFTTCPSILSPSRLRSSLMDWNIKNIHRKEKN